MDRKPAPKPWDDPPEHSEPLNLEPIPENLPNLRDEKGRFAKGNFGGGPGAGHVSALRKALSSAVTVQDIQDITRKLVELAKEGDIQAANLLFTRLFGHLHRRATFVEDKSVTVQIRNLSDRELVELERLALKAVPTEGRVIEQKGECE